MKLIITDHAYDPQVRRHVEQEIEFDNVADFKINGPFIEVFYADGTKEGRRVQGVTRFKFINE